MINLRMDSLNVDNACICLHPFYIFKEITNTAQADVVSWCWTSQYGTFYSSKMAKIDKDGVVLTEYKSYCVYSSSEKILHAFTCV